MNNHIKIPKIFFEVQYNSSRIPNIKDQSDLTLGANCQVFAFELLKVNGITAPNFRSSELYSDTIYTEKVEIFKPLDLMLYNNNNNSFGAHVGVYIGNEKIIHLSLENGYAQIIEHQEMIKNRKYNIFIGAKRVLK